jgi:hypothetical protein
VKASRPLRGQSAPPTASWADPVELVPPFEPTVRFDGRFEQVVHPGLLIAALATASSERLVAFNTIGQFIY